MKILDKIVRNEKRAIIVFFGDSVTRGCFEGGVCDEENSFVTKFKKIISLLYPESEIKIVNSGIGGNNAVDGLNRFDRDVAAYKPDLVVTGFALNDACCGEDYLPVYRKTLSQICENVNGLSAEHIFLTPNLMCYYVGDKVREDLRQTAESFIKLQKNDMLDKIVGIEKDVALKYGIKVCDVYSAWKKLKDNRVDTTELLANGLNHPIREAHDYIAIKIIETIFEIK